MKKLFIYIITAMALVSCGDFLEETSQDLIVPTKPHHFKELIYGELIKGEVPLDNNVELMSDNVSSIYQVKNSEQDNRVKTFGFYAWQQSVEYDYNNAEAKDKMYEELYAGIVLCNAIEKELESVSGTESEMASLYGEIYFYRALYYYYLANLYGTPYVDAASAAQSKCVPINTNTGIADELYVRSTHKEVYDLMIENIVRSVDKFAESTEAVTIYRPNYEAACVLATRIFLTTKQFTKVIEYADKMEQLETFYNLSDHLAKNDTIVDVFEDIDIPNFINESNSEILFTHFNGFQANAFTYNTTGSAAGAYVPSPALVESYETGDLRKIVFFDRENNLSKVTENINKHTVFFSNIRSVEAFLNKAEALAMTSGDAIAELNKLRAARFESEVPAISGDALTAVKQERYRELCFDGIRWFDLRRWGMPELTHEFPLEDGTRKVVFTLYEGDPAYTLSLPMDVTELNDKIERHVRPERPGETVN
ncbi:RagB/SusD family nutrient uptake outer membrane protein [Carboxylicivirga sp. RSCT41]|uniref:RagB/SusD family nutrient uptake outer membrane protein n=1 Tax=Carboxylicivirga agarovorans TaxID=3417570 RepID=UPI003D3381FB